MSARVVALVLAGALAAPPLAAQMPRFTGADGSLSRIRFHSAAQGGSESLSGFAAGAQARFVRGRVTMDVSYAQGRLTPGDGSAQPRSLVDGSLSFAYRPKPWLVVKTGPHLRGFVTPSGTERWAFWEAHVRGESAIIPEVLDAHVEGWLALLSGVNVPAGAGGAHGGEAGLTLRFAEWPFSFRFAYAVDRAKLANDVRRETFESVFLGITYTRR